MTNQDTVFSARFPDITVNNYVATGQLDLSSYQPTQSPINSGMLSDIGRATIYGPEIQTNPYSGFLKSPLQRGDSALTARFSQLTSGAYNSLVGDSALFNATRPDMLANVITKNFSRQCSLEMNDRLMKQFVQTPEMIDQASSAIVANLNACYMDDMYTASNEYFAGSVRGAGNDQMVTLTNAPGTAGFGDEFVEAIWQASEKDFAFKSTRFNKSAYNTKADSVSIIMDKSVEYKGFKKLYSETFNPDYIKTKQVTGFVDSFPTVAGKPVGAGDLLAIVADTRAFEIVPMPDAYVIESFRNPSRHSTAYFCSYEYAFGHNPFFNVKYIFAPAS